jgi:hypothetical protein
MTANTTFVSGAVLTAAQMNALPWGVTDATSGGTSSRAWIKINAAQSVASGAAIVDVTSSTFTFTGVAGRLYKYSYIYNLEWAGSGGYAAFSITDGTNTVLKLAPQVDSKNGFMQYTDYYIFTLTGSGTIKTRVTNSASNLTLNGTGTKMGFAQIEDIGPST